MLSLTESREYRPNAVELRSSLRARQRLGNGLHFFCRLHRRRDLRLSQLAVYTVHIDKLRPYDTSRPTSFQTRILDGSQNHFPLSPFRHLPYLAQAESLMERKCLGNPFQTSKSRYNSRSCRFGKAALRTQQTNQGLRSREVIPKTHHRAQSHRESGMEIETWQQQRDVKPTEKFRVWKEALVIRSRLLRCFNFVFLGVSVPLW